VSANAALMTLGNFTDAFQRRDLSKMSIGFIQDIGAMICDLLMKHLVSRAGYSKSSAETAIKLHKRLLEREFWDMVFAPLAKHATSGVNVYILGKGIRTVFPVLAYCVGDDPALHRYCGVYEGNALHSCLYCKYSCKKDGLFVDDGQGIIRDPAEIRDLCATARSGELK
jgi:hypothetical protein